MQLDETKRSYFDLPVALKRQAKTKAAALGLTLTQFLIKVLREDVERTGVAEFVGRANQQEEGSHE